MRGLALALFVALALPMAASAGVYPPRPDVIWARQTTETMTLDGVLGEPGWALADSHVVRYRFDAGIPGSGFKAEGGVPSRDTLHAVIRFLARGTKLWMGVTVRDSSVGGSNTFNNNDGFLMNLRDHSKNAYPAPNAEYFYTWWRDSTASPGDSVPGSSPVFIGQWGNRAPNWNQPRSPAQIDAWNAVTRVHGLSNNDAVPDTGYTVEMVFDVGVMGYDIQRPGGDIMEWNISIYDCDWYWPLIQKFSTNRTWWQAPWGNTGWYHEVRVVSQPEVNMVSGAFPELPPEYIIPSAGGAAAPVIDGKLDEPVWSLAPSFVIAYDDPLVRDSYPGVARWRAGQFQPDVNGGKAIVEDPGRATIKYFFKADTLYLGFDMQDAYIQYYSLVDRWDGFLVSMNDRTLRNPDRVLMPRRLSFIVGPDGKALPQDYLPLLVDSAGAKVALQLGPGSTVDTLGNDFDSGYTAELAIVLTSMGYPASGFGGLLFLGIDMFDGDSFTPYTLSYGTRSWWYREFEGTTSSSWAYMDPTVMLAPPVGVEEGDAPVAAFAALGNYPNPFRAGTVLRFATPSRAAVTLEVFDVQGRSVARRDLGVFAAGTRAVSFDGKGLGAGLYFYRMRMTDPASGALQATLSGRMMSLK